jgi:predicted SAM-dependent methyltransferase
MTRLHLGCGLDHRPGAINLDRYELAGADVQADVLRLPLPGESVTHVETRHLLEHLGYAGAIYALAECWRVLVPGGTLLVETPDRGPACRAAAAPAAEPQAVHWAFGLPLPGYAHRTLFDAADLRAVAERAGLDAVEVDTADREQAVLRLRARKGSDLRAELLARLHVGFLAAGILDPLTAPPHLAGLEQVCDAVLAAVDLVPRDGVDACLAALLGAAARRDPRAATVALELLVARGLVPPAPAAPYLALARCLAAEAFPARQAAYLRQQPALPGSQAARLRRLEDRVSLYLTACLHPGEAALRPLRSEFDAAAAGLSAADREITFFCAESVADLARRETARGVRAFARGRLERAAHHLGAAAAYDADNALARWNLARLALARGQRLVALEQYAGLLELLPEAAALSAEMDAVTGRAGGSPATWCRPVAREGLP